MIASVILRPRSILTTLIGWMSFMANFSKDCTLCGSTQNLHTLMDVIVEGKQYKAAICENCEDFATPKAVREAVASQVSKQGEIDKEKADLIKRARSLGLILADPSQIPIHESEKPKALPPQPGKTGRLVSQRHEDSVTDPDAPAESVPAHAVLRPDQHVAPVASGKGLSWHGEQVGSYDLARGIDVRGKDGEVKTVRVNDMVVESAIVEGREGQPVRIPTRFRGDPGETVVNYVKVNDREIQQRFKALNEHPISGKYGATRDCPMCKASGLSRGHQCAKCNGRGYISYI